MLLPQVVMNYFNRVGAEVLNFRRAMVKEYKGSYYEERALIKLTNDGEVICSVKDYAPTDEERAEIKTALAGVEFPRTIGARSIDGLLDMGKSRDSLYEFWNRKSNEITMVQERKTDTEGRKAYIPWVFLSNGEWMAMEPDGPLPFWVPKGRGQNGSDRNAIGRIMIHEGAKPAAAVEAMLMNGRDHPWADELAQFEHWGMIGGALAPHRTDYDQLRAEKPTEVVYVCDNDVPGATALQKVSECWGHSLKGIIFGSKFPPSWDMADPMPKELFRKSGRYVGPRLRDLMDAATFATEVIPPKGKGRSVHIIRQPFIEEWLHCITPEVFVHRDWPNRILNTTEFNSKIAPFSHVDDTARLLKKQYASKTTVLKYVPSEEPGIHAGSKSGLYINTYCKCDIAPETGDAAPWLDFMERLLPNASDRLEMLRWCATLIARPDIRMLYGVLLISETQGVGKGTLGEKILAPLVGETNVSFPSEQEIVDSAFNYWLAHKRLAVVHEIYAGQSSKAYNKLKSAITDRFITVQKKYQANYEIENWIHIFACSNSLRAMKLSMDDRRWFVPKITEEKQASGYWDSFNDWLNNQGGLGIIRWWAADWLRGLGSGPVMMGDAAPWSALKRQIVEEGYSPGQALVARILEDLSGQIMRGELPPDSFVLDLDLVGAIRDELYEGRHNDRLERPATVRTIAKAMGWTVGEIRAQIKAWGPNTIGSRVISLDPIVAGRAPSDLGGEKLPAEKRRAPVALAGRRAM